MALTDLTGLLSVQQNGGPPEAPIRSVEDVVALLEYWAQWFADQFFSMGTVYQVGALTASAIIAYFVSRFPTRRLKAMAESRESADILFRIYKSAAKVTWPVIFVILLWIATTAFDAGGLPNELLRISASLLAAWIIVRLVTSNMREGFWSNAMTLLAWTVAALYILRLLEPVTGYLQATEFSIAGATFNLYQLITSVVVAVVALWAGRIAGDAAQSSLKSSKSLTPSLAGLLGQVAKIGLMVFAVLFALNAVGVNLTALTIFSGALGVGIGFGLQAIFSNFISGVIILFEKSVKVGDFIELQSGVTGLVREINIRSTLVTTNDNVDILVPNEEFIKAQVINWTLKETKRRMHISFGVAYGTDKELVRKAGLEAAAEVEWTFDDGGGRAPQVWLVGFGDSSLDFELVVWLTEEAVVRPARVTADYNWAIHTALYKYDIEIPFPQRDVNFDASAPVTVRIEKTGEDA